MFQKNIFFINLLGLFYFVLYGKHEVTVTTVFTLMYFSSWVSLQLLNEHIMLPWPLDFRYKCSCWTSCARLILLLAHRLCIKTQFLISSTPPFFFLQCRAQCACPASVKTTCVSPLCFLQCQGGEMRTLRTPQHRNAHSSEPDPAIASPPDTPIPSPNTMG